MGKGVEGVCKTYFSDLREKWNLWGSLEVRRSMETFCSKWSEKRNPRRIRESMKNSFSKWIEKNEIHNVGTRVYNTLIFRDERKMKSAWSRGPASLWKGNFSKWSEKWNPREGMGSRVYNKLIFEMRWKIKSPEDRGSVNFFQSEKKNNIRELAGGGSPALWKNFFKVNRTMKSVGRGRGFVKKTFFKVTRKIKSVGESQVYEKLIFQSIAKNGISGSSWSLWNISFFEVKRKMKSAGGRRFVKNYFFKVNW